MKPLLEETEDALERKLLEEARDYKASDRARIAALAIVGTGKPLSFFRGAGLKVALAVVAVGAIGGAWWLRRPPTPVTHADPPAPIAVATETTKAPIIHSPSTDPAVDPATLPQVTEKTAKPVVTGVPAEQSATKSTLSEEIALIDRARAAVYSKDREGAVRALDEYDRRFPKGSLAPEAKTLRVRAGTL